MVRACKVRQPDFYGPLSRGQGSDRIVGKPTSLQIEHSMFNMQGCSSQNPDCRAGRVAASGGGDADRTAPGRENDIAPRNRPDAGTGDRRGFGPSKSNAASPPQSARACTRLSATSSHERPSSCTREKNATRSARESKSSASANSRTCWRSCRGANAPTAG